MNFLSIEIDAAKVLDYLQSETNIQKKLIVERRLASLLKQKVHPRDISDSTLTHAERSLVTQLIEQIGLEDKVFNYSHKGFKALCTIVEQLEPNGAFFTIDVGTQTFYQTNQHSVFQYGLTQYHGLSFQLLAAFCDLKNYPYAKQQGISSNTNTAFIITHDASLTELFNQSFAKKNCLQFDALLEERFSQLKHASLAKSQEFLSPQLQLSFQANYMVASLLSHKKLYEQAKQYCQKALDLVPNALSIYLLQCAIAIDEKNYQLAVEIANKSLAIAPHMTNFYDALVIIYEQLNDRENKNQSLQLKHYFSAAPAHVRPHVLQQPVAIFKSLRQSISNDCYQLGYGVFFSEEIPFSSVTCPYNAEQIVALIVDAATHHQD